MSSIIAHSLIGAAIGDNAKAAKTSDKAFLYLFFVALSISPDLDYLAIWLLDVHVDPRYSHSIAGCLLISLVGLFSKRYLFSNKLANAHSALIIITPMSHLVLDYFVGVHKNPLFWPISSELYTFSYGILPSAGRLDITNFYFWRNLAIELGVLVPVAIMLSSSRSRIVENKFWLVLALLSFLSFGSIGFSLYR